MRHRRTSIARPALAIALALASAPLAGCAEMHRGVEAVGRVGSAAAPAAEAPAAEADAAPLSRPGIRTVRPRGAPRAPAVDAAEAPAAAVPTVLASAVPSPRQIFEFHPAGARPDSWRQPFVIDTNDGPLAADVRRSAAELRAFLAARKDGDARTAPAAAGKVDGIRTGTARKICGEMDVAAGKPGCGVPRPRAATAAATPGAPAVP